ncbi:hypothetical protein HELRODRAFT_110114 [Helobdella robusta]|uniref:Mitochondrial 2-oxodicarboxylate carrier n=1 Tax=Helobdella robusta TaxID=6412 RepID=T1EEZ3_HELRO|nr:hypothetical protein HELRODRAFT_110114 [Helobdella robusta]ESO08547.1 hypothetical protein HELRODRAFT_110114 [Helobdella robusta]
MMTAQHTTDGKLSYATLAALQIVSGGSAGFVEICLMHPLDLIKTRFQIQRGIDDPNRYLSMFDCIKKIYRIEGPLSFYKGILPPILMETPKRAIKFFSFEQFKKLFSLGKDHHTFINLTFAGLCAGLTEAVFATPFEAVKVQLQAERNQFTQQQSAYSKAREIIKTSGLGTTGLFKGLSSTMIRNGVFNMVYFSFYHNMVKFIPKNDKNDIAYRLGIGFFAGTFGSVANIPFDVAKSRIQAPQQFNIIITANNNRSGNCSTFDGHTVKYRTCLATVAMIYKEEGFLALYKGLLPKVMRLGPGGAIMLVVYEKVHKELSSWVMNL